jgi:hypothetical protein
VISDWENAERTQKNLQIEDLLKEKLLLDNISKQLKDKTILITALQVLSNEIVRQVLSLIQKNHYFDQAETFASFKETGSFTPNYYHSGGYKK